MREPDLLAAHDAVICDLDGAVYRGTEPIPYAVDALAAVMKRGMPVMFATNNDTRTDREIAARLTAMGLTTEANQVVTAPQVVADLIARHHPADTKVAAFGSPALSAALHSAGLLVCYPGEGAGILAQGLMPSTTPADLTSLADAIGTAHHWFVTNTDRMVVRESGPMPGNGTILQSLRKLTQRSPVLAGKPDRICCTWRQPGSRYPTASDRRSTRYRHGSGTLGRHGKPARHDRALRPGQPR